MHPLPHTFHAKSYNPLKAFYITSVIGIAVTIAIIFIFKTIKSPKLGLLAWIAIMTIPFLFQKAFKEKFTKKLRVSFDDTCLSVIEDAVPLKTTTALIIPWKEIKSYNFYYNEGVHFSLKINLTNGKSKRFTFNIENDTIDIFKDKSIFSAYFSYVHLNNEKIGNTNKIKLLPNYFATKSGSILLFLVLALAIVSIITCLIINPSKGAFSFMALFMLLGLYTKRSTDKLMYNKLQTLQPIVL